MALEPAEVKDCPIGGIYEYECGCRFQRLDDEIEPAKGWIIWCSIRQLHACSFHDGHASRNSDVLLASCLIDPFVNALEASFA